MGKRSVKEKYLKEQRQYHAKFKNRLKPPYRCPKCFRERAVRVKKEKLLKIIEINDKKWTKVEYQYQLWCQCGCFSTTLTYNSAVFEAVDAYCEVVDKILGERQKTVSVVEK